MKNHNIKAILFDQNISDYNSFADKVKKYGVKTVLLEPDIDFCTIHERIRVPVFHCAVLASSGDILETARSAGFKTVSIGNKTAHADLYADDINDINPESLLEFSRIKPYRVHEYAFEENEPDYEDARHMESVFALANGYMGLRGTYDECCDSMKSEPGMYINGVFETQPLNFLCYNKGFPRNEQFMVNLPDWRITELYIDGEKASLTAGNISNHLRCLNFREGTLTRSFEFTTNSGKKALVESTRIVNMVRLHSAHIRYSVKPVNFSGAILIKSTVAKIPLTNGKNAISVYDEKFHDDGITLTVKTNRTSMEAACSIKHKIICSDYSVSAKNTDDVYEFHISANAVQNENIVVEKYASFYACVDNTDDVAVEAYREVCRDAELGFDYLAEAQARFWAEHWQKGDIIIDGSPEDQQAVRFSLFQLRQQLPGINNVSIGANGLSGAIYGGKVFWDTEMYLMPYYLYTEPEGCKRLLLYRCNLLDKARERAMQLGAVGALYSWASIDGEETSVVHEASTAEYHINSDIAYAVWRYYNATGDREFVYKHCAEMLFETAKFTAHRGCFVEAYDNRFCINSVCGPDEYACAVNNNCYTNLMAQFHFRFALSVHDEMLEQEPELLQSILHKTGIDDKELSLWRRAADNMYYRINERYNIYEQDDKFVYNDPVDMEMIPKNFDIRWQYHPLDLWRMQVLKQADVLMLMFVLSHKFTTEEKRSNYNYYEPKTNHGSSLSAVIHSITANEIGCFKEAYEYFRCGAFMDIADVKKNAWGGLHIACIGGVWLSVVNGFLGMRVSDAGLVFNVALPDKWNRCVCRVRYRDAVIEVRAGRIDTEFVLVHGSEISFEANGRNISLCKENSSFTINNESEEKI